MSSSATSLTTTPPGVDRCLHGRTSARRAIFVRIGPSLRQMAPELRHPNALEALGGAYAGMLGHRGRLSSAAEVADKVFRVVLAATLPPGRDCSRALVDGPAALLVVKLLSGGSILTRRTRRGGRTRQNRR